MSPTPKAALIWSLLPRTMYWSIPSMKRVNPTTHMGQLVTTMRRGRSPYLRHAHARLLARRSPEPSVGTSVSRRVAGRQADGLHLQEALEALGPELTPDARLLEPAERRREVDRDRAR